jgi:hypothetical protein
VLPAEVVKRLLEEGDVLGLKMGTPGNNGVPQLYYFLIDTKEGPNDLEDYSLGSATGQNTTGTDWSEITDSQGRYLLEPEFEGNIFQVYYGVYPSYAWIYRRYPSNVDRGSLRGVRTIGDRTYRVGKIDGQKSPYRTPSPLTELFTMKGMHPAFLGYHPYLEPATTTIRLNFYVTKYGVRYLSSPTEAQKAKAQVRILGGEALIEIPQWLR